jgi:hypothetical protein
MPQMITQLKNKDTNFFNVAQLPFFYVSPAIAETATEEPKPTVKMFRFFAYIPDTWKTEICLFQVRYTKRTKKIPQMPRNVKISRQRRTRTPFWNRGVRVLR